MKAIGATIAREDLDRTGRPSLYGQAWFARPIVLRCEQIGTSHKRITAWCKLADGRDLSCAAIRAGVAVRWERYDRARRLKDCQ